MVRNYLRIFKKYTLKLPKSLLLKLLNTSIFDSFKNNLLKLLIFKLNFYFKLKMKKSSIESTNALKI